MWRNVAMLRAAKLAANAKPFRYLCYPVIGCGFLLLDQPPPSSAAAVLGWCLLWPLAVDLGQRRASAKTILNVHLAEAAFASGLFAWASLPPSLLFAVGIILVASNALQGGIRQALLAILCTMAGLAAGDFASPAASVFAVPAAAAFSSLLVLAYCALLGHWAHRQALGMAGQRAQMRVMNARLQQYLPHTLADRLKAAEQPRLERRWLVVAFADLAGFTPLVERLAVEELTPVLDSYLKGRRRRDPALRRHLEQGARRRRDAGFRRGGHRKSGPGWLPMLCTAAACWTSNSPNWRTAGAPKACRSRCASRSAWPAATARWAIGAAADAWNTRSSASR